VKASDYQLVIEENLPASKSQLRELAADFRRHGRPKPRRDLTVAQFKEAKSDLAKLGCWDKVWVRSGVHA